MLIDVMSRSCVLSAALLIVAVSPSLAADAADNEFTVAVAQTELRFWPTADDFAGHMSRRVEEAMEHSPDLIVFPEDIGLPLIALGDADIIAEAGDVEAAIGGMLARHSAEAGALVVQHGVSPQRALWLLKAAQVSNVYQETFSALARKHKVHIAAGSVPLVLPDRPAEVFNTACVFDSAGAMQIAGTKVNLVAPFETQDGLDFASGSVEDYAVFRMPGATVGIIVCADGWQPAIAEALVEQGAEVLVQISANPEVWTDGTRTGWQDSLFSRVQQLEVYGVCVMGVGNLLGLPFQGRSSIVAPRDWTADGSGFVAEVGSATEEALLVVRLDPGRRAGR